MKIDTPTRTRSVDSCDTCMTWCTVKPSAVILVCHLEEKFEKRRSGAYSFPTLTKALYSVDLHASLTSSHFFLHCRYMVRETFVVVTGIPVWIALPCMYMILIHISPDVRHLGPSQK